MGPIGSTGSFGHKKTCSMAGFIDSINQNWLSPAHRKRTRFPQPSISNITQLAPIMSLKNEDFLRQKYLEEGLSLQEIAAETVSSWKTVRRRLLYLRIPLKPQDSTRSTMNTKFGTVIIDGSKTVEETEAKTISYITSLREKGCSFRQIVAQLNLEKIPTRKVGALWHIKTVYNVLAKSERLSNAQLNSEIDLNGPI